ncbi:hypothetical protein [Planobispora rosea]|uniref:hypothetical protein n=1 Tax=Planobispora rosea TaxID=35762 RepID=UPI00083B25A8|nr:hypothetical protein [Planobispora rosea]
MAVWDEVRDIIDAGDRRALVERMTALTGDERREVARELPGYLEVLRERAQTGERARQAGWETAGEEDDRWFDVWGRTEPWDDSGELLRIAGAGSLGGAAAVSAWLGRRDLLTTWPSPDGADRRAFGDPGPVVAVLSRRPPEWQAEATVRLVRKIRDGRDPGASLALAMLRRTGIEPPEHDPLVVAWLHEEPRMPFRQDPLLDALLPRIFEAEGVGRTLRDNTGMATELAALGVEGRVRRDLLLDGCVRRFLRGGPAADLSFFVRLHETLDPAPAEVAPRARDYLRLLPTAPGPVAEAALARLRGLPPGTVADPEELGDAMEGLLFRGEVKLVGAGLSWLAELLPREDVDAFAPALATAVTHDSLGIQGRAVRLALKNAGRWGPEAREVFAGLTGSLPGEFGAGFAGAFGGEPASVPVVRRRGGT